MPVIRIVLLFIVVGGLALLAFSNLSPVLPLVFLGMPTAPLPLATWIGIAIASGVATSFFLQFLQFIQGTSNSFAEPDAAPQPTSFRREQEPVYSRQTVTAPPPPVTPKTNTASDWEENNAQNWEFEQQSTTKTPVAPDQMGATEQPKSSPSGVYSYSYREQDKKQAGVGKADAIYDANYRVINPPNTPSNPIKPDDDDEDWGFDDDDEFNDESKNTKPRR